MPTTDRSVGRARPPPGTSSGASGQIAGKRRATYARPVPRLPAHLFTESAPASSHCLYKENGLNCVVWAILAVPLFFVLHVGCSKTSWYSQCFSQRAPLSVHAQVQGSRTPFREPMPFFRMGPERTQTATAGPWSATRAPPGVARPADQGSESRAEL